MPQEDVQLLHDHNNNSFLSFCPNGHVQICHRINLTLTQTLKKSIQVLYRNFSGDNANVTVTFLSAQKHKNGHNCGLLAVVFPAEILDGKSRIDAIFYVPQLCNRRIYCLGKEALTPFSKI